jgi:hypothetical protein
LCGSVSSRALEVEITAAEVKLEDTWVEIEAPRVEVEVCFFSTAANVCI